VPDLLDVQLDDGVIVVRYDGRPNDAAFNAYLERYTELVHRGQPYATVYSTLPDARIPTGSNARKQAAWMKNEREAIAGYCQGLAFALPSPVMRGVLRGILAMQPLGAEHIVVDDEAEAIEWARARLR
jgi:hypothetical protein